MATRPSCDAEVIGAGLSGLYTARHLPPVAQKFCRPSSKHCLTLHGVDTLTNERRETSTPMSQIYATAAVASFQD